MRARYACASIGVALVALASLTAALADGEGCTGLRPGDHGGSVYDPEQGTVSLPVEGVREGWLRFRVDDPTCAQEPAFARRIAHVLDVADEQQRDECGRILSALTAGAHRVRGLPFDRAAARRYALRWCGVERHRLPGDPPAAAAPVLEQVAAPAEAEAGRAASIVVRWRSYVPGEGVVVVCRSARIDAGWCLDGTAAAAPATGPRVTVAFVASARDAGVRTYFVFACDAAFVCSRPVEERVAVARAS